MMKKNKVPRNIRKQLEKKLDKIEKDLVSRFGLIQMALKDPADHSGQNTFPMREVTTWNPDWMSESGAPWTDPMTGQTKNIRISNFKTFGRMGDKTKAINVSRKNFTRFVQECKTLMDVLDPNGLIAKESLGDYGDSDSSQFGTWNAIAQNGTGATNGKYLPFQPSPFSRQIYTQDQWMMLARAAELVNYNPLAKAGVHIKSAFTIGKGPKIIISSPKKPDMQGDKDPEKNTEKAQTCWNEYEERVKYGNRLCNRDRMLSTNGEFFLELYTGEDGIPISKSIDPGTVYDIIAEPRDIDIVYGLALMFSTRYQTFTTGAKGEQVPVSEFVYETISPDNVCHLKINVQENEMRGRSDLMPVMNVCDWFMDYLKFKILQAWVHAAFAWDVTMKNAQQEDVDSMSENLNAQPPAPMTIQVHNDQVEFKPLQATASTGGSKSGIIEEIVTTFCCGFLMPTEYIGLSTTGNRATSITKTEPSVKIFGERRQLWEPTIKKEVAFVVKAKTEIDLNESDIEIAWDEIAPENITDRIQDLLIGLVNKSITKKRYDTMYAKLLDINSYDWDSEQDEIAQEILKDPMIQNIGKTVPSKPPFSTPVPSATTQPPAGQNPADPQKKEPPNPISNSGAKEIKKQHQVI